jgi:uncharacterized repeat protein (TIGR03803 family)
MNVLAALPLEAQTVTTLHSFIEQVDGELPYAGLVQGTDKNFYGTTEVGGANGAGTVFKITPSGILTTLHSFDGDDGSGPYAGLVQGADGSFYGTASSGGSNPCGCGTVFKITPSGTLTTLHSFGGTDGTSPYGGLVQGADGNFYGTTEQGGASSTCPVGGGCGTVFMIAPSGTLTTLYSFDATPDGAEPWGALVQGTDGNFYGTTEQGGAYADGTVFRLASSLSTFSLTVVGLGQGTVTSLDYKINCSNVGGVCRANYAAGASVTFGAAPAAGWSFTGWSGPCSGIASCNLTMNGNQSVTATFTPAYTISGQVTLDGSGLTGVTVSLRGSSSGSTTTNVSGSYSFPVIGGGSYSVTPALTDYTFSPGSTNFDNLSGNQTANFTATQAVPSIAISSVSPSYITLVQGGSSQAVTVSLTRTNYTGSISLVNSALPSGVTATIAQPGTVNTGSITLQAASSATPVSNQAITITASGSGVPSVTATFTLTVDQPSIAISLNPSAITLNRGGIAQNVTVSLTRNGYAGSLTLSTSTLPSGVTATLTQPGTGDAGSISLSAASSATLVSNQTITITAGRSGASSVTATFALTVTAAASTDFSLMALPSSFIVAWGGSGTSTITTAVSGSFNSAIALTASGLPSGVSVSFTPAKIAAPGSGASTLKIMAGAGSSTGTNTITVTATGGGKTHTTTVALSIKI